MWERLHLLRIKNFVQLKSLIHGDFLMQDQEKQTSQEMPAEPGTAAAGQASNGAETVAIDAVASLEEQLAVAEANGCG